MTKFTVATSRGELDLASTGHEPSRVSKIFWRAEARNLDNYDMNGNIREYCLGAVNVDLSKTALDIYSPVRNVMVSYNILMKLIDSICT